MHYSAGLGGRNDFPKAFYCCSGWGVRTFYACESRLGLPGLPGFRRCSVGVTVGVGTARQECVEWCWAACVEAIFTFHEHPVAQRRIVEKVFNSDICRGAIGPQIVEAINGTWTDDQDNNFDAECEVLWDSQFQFGRSDAVDQAARELEAGNPLILGAMGHATLLTAMTYSGNGILVELNELIIRDPWPGNPNRRALTLIEAMNTQFLAKVTIG
jgi:Papain-like cysteine protease AvrRpt2